MENDNFLGWDLDDLVAPIPIDPPWAQQVEQNVAAGNFRRSWPDKSRREWNSDPIHSDGTACTACGYKWHPLEIVANSNGRCFSCYMIEDKPDEVARYWRIYRENYGGNKEKHGETAAPKLVKLDIKKEK